MSDTYRIKIDSDLPGGDYRHSPITVSGFDPAVSSELLSQAEPLRAQLYGEGVIRLFRDFGGPPPGATPEHTAAADDTMVLILALPTYFMAADLLGFVGPHYVDDITHIRVLKSEKPNRFLVLLKFRDSLTAADFQYHFDGKPFNSMEPETCHVVFVRSVVVDPGCLVAADPMIPFLLPDPFTNGNSTAVLSRPLLPTLLDLLPTDLLPPLPTNALPLLPGPLLPGFLAQEVELPSCPVCLERLDSEVLGLLTIPCQHTFHCQCLSKWRDDTCPVCRYTNSVANQRIRRLVRRLSQINPRPRLDQPDTCDSCTTSDNLWVCLVCGVVGCSRYAPAQHLLQHFVETGHCFAMELDSSRVWDYAGDTYVHRLITSETDGKIVELDEKPHPKKDESLDLELLLSQLISQREYYELLLLDGVRRRGLLVLALADGRAYVRRNSEKQAADTERRLDDLRKELDKVTRVVVPALQRKVDMKDVSLKVAVQELKEATALTEGMSQRIDALAAENELLRRERDDLQEQVKDLMFFVEAREKLKDQPEDVREGLLVMKPRRKRK